MFFKKTKRSEWYQPKKSWFRPTIKGLPDLLNYATLVDPGTVLCKDGALIAGWYYKGDDLNSSTAEELNTLSSRLNNIFRTLGTGWTLQVDALRISSPGYPAENRLHFPDKITRLIDNERRAFYEQDYKHYETIYALTLAYLPPNVAQTKLEQLMYTEGSKNKETVAEKILRDFSRWCNEFESSFGSYFKIQKMGRYEVADESSVFVRDELAEYLNWCITSTYEPINVCRQNAFLDGVLGFQDFIGGIEPKIGEKHIAIVSFSSFPLESYPSMLSVLDTLPIEYRWSNRFVYLDTEDAKTELNRFRRYWKQKEKGLLDQFFNTKTAAIDKDALEMTEETDFALADASSNLVAFGYYTAVLVLTNEDRAVLTSAAKEISRIVRNLGFGSIIETLNTIAAWLGSLPGHGYSNLRRPLIHTMNLVDFIPTSSIWAGSDNNPCPKYPSDSPALIYTDTDGSTTFRLNVHVSDVGHFLVFGPTGSGKTTLLNILAAQFRKYKNSQFFCFDKGYGMYAITKACGGIHYDVAGETSQLSFCPFGDIKSDSEQAWAEDWVVTLCVLQLNRPLDPVEKKALREAMSLHRNGSGISLGDFISTLQNLDLRNALEHYSIDGAMGRLLDAEQDSLELSDFQVFEMDSLMDLSDADKLPVLLYIFERIRRRLDGRPSMILMDECWVLLGHPVFREKIIEWLKVLRKANCVVGMATQSLSDASKSGILDVLIESCPTKIYLPNKEAATDKTSLFYEEMGLNKAQIDIIAKATPKRQYYCVSWDGCRLFDLALGPVSLAFAGKAGKKDKIDIDNYIETFGESWPLQWLKKQGVRYEDYPK